MHTIAGGRCVNDVWGMRAMLTTYLGFKDKDITVRHRLRVEAQAACGGGVARAGGERRQQASRSTGVVGDAFWGTF